MELKSDIEGINKSMKRKADASWTELTNDLQDKVSTLEREHKKLRSETELSFKDAANEIYAISKMGTGTVGSADSPDVNYRIGKLDKELETLKQQVLKVDLQDKNNLSFQVGKFISHSIDDVGAWADEHLLPDYPFGPFVDAY